MYSATWYWFTALVFLAVDFSQNPKMVTKFKTQPGKNAPPPLKKVLKVIRSCMYRYSILHNVLDSDIMTESYLLWMKLHVVFLHRTIMCAYNM